MTVRGFAHGLTSALALTWWMWLSGSRLRHYNSVADRSGAGWTEVAPLIAAQLDHDTLSRPVTVDERHAAGVHRLIVECFDLSSVDGHLIASCRLSRPTSKPMGIAAEFPWYGMQAILANILGEQQRHRNIGG